MKFEQPTIEIRQIRTEDVAATPGEASTVSSPANGDNFDI